MFRGLTSGQYTSLTDYPALTYGLAESPFGTMAVAWWPDSKKGDKICYLSLKSGELKALHALQDLFPKNTLSRDDKRAASFVKSYFKNRNADCIPVLLKGSEFYLEVWKKLYASKPGFTASYGELAGLCGRPLASRAVGRAMATNPVALIVPCHRILAANGLGGYGYGPEIKKKLLAEEKDR